MKYLDTAMRAVLMTLMLSVIGMIIWNETRSESVVKVRVDLSDSAIAAEVLPQLGSSTHQVTDVRAIDASKNQYELTFRCAKKKQSLLGWILDKDWVEHAEIDEDDDD